MRQTRDARSPLAAIVAIIATLAWSIGLSLGLPTAARAVPQPLALVIDSDAGSGGLGALFRVDATGTRTLLSDFGDPAQGATGVDPHGAAIAAGGEIFVLDYQGGTGGLGALFNVHPDTGLRTMLSDFGNPAQGLLGFSPFGIAVASGGEVLVADPNAGSAGRGLLFLIDASGARTVLSDFGDGTQGLTGNDPRGVTVGADGKIYVIDTSSSLASAALFLVDPSNGQRTVLSRFGDPAQGWTQTGASFPWSLAAGDDGRIAVVDSGMRLLIDIDAASGFRTLLSDFNDASQGPLASSAAGVGVGGQILVLDYDGGAGNAGALLTVDPTTGVRSVLSDFGNPAQGPTGVTPFGIAVPVIPTVELIEACDFEQDATESADRTRHYVEQGRTTVRLCRPLPVDIADPGRYGPKTTGEGFNESATLSPDTIPAETEVRSFVVHADRAYTVTKNGDYLYRNVFLQFTGGTVLGIVVRDPTLNTTDVLGAPGTWMPTGLAHRGHEVNVRSGKQFLNKEDLVVLTDDRSAVGLRLQVGEAMDQVRIITTAGAELASSSTGFRTVPPPPSLLQDEFNTEICQGPGTPSYQSCKDGGTIAQVTTDDIAVLFEQTDQDVRLRDALAVNISEPGTYDELPPSTTIVAGTPIRSHLLHVDRPGRHDQFATGDFAYFVGRVTFDEEILGIVTSEALLNASDLLGASGTYYPTGWPNRGADYGLGAGFASDEQITLSADRRTITFQLQTGNGLDQLRVITAADSGP